jgi:hypothetical protein
MGTIRVVVAGAAAFRNDRTLRDALDHLLQDRLPDVTILTRSGAGLGTDSLALSDALAHRLDVVQYQADHQADPALFDADAICGRATQRVSRRPGKAPRGARFHGGFSAAARYYFKG